MRREDGTEPMELKPGEYAFYKGQWWAATPTDDLANLKNHGVEVHDDDTITVSPSIRVSGAGGRELYHGYLERGSWRSC